MDPQPTTPGRGTILVVGAGATGGFFGALLAKRGQDVTFLVRPPRAAALRQHGLRVTGQGHDDLIDAKVVTSRDLAGPFNLVLLSVKATGLAEALDDLAPAVGPDTAVVPFLNGLDHMRAGSPMTSSLYRDLQAGRGTEVEQILGDLISRARALGVATPVHDLATLALRVHQLRIHNAPPPQRPAG